MRIALVIGILTTLASSARAATPPTLADVGWLAREGSWTIEGQWSNGNPFRAVARYERVLDGKFIAGRSWTHTDDGAVTRESVMYGEQDGRLVQWTFARDGSARTSLAERDPADGTLEFPWTRTTADGSPQRLRQRITPAGEDRFDWTVMMEIRGEWHTLIRGQWVLEPQATAPLPVN